MSRTAFTHKAFAAAYGGKAAQLGTMAPWPFHPLVIQRGEQSIWCVIDMRQGIGTEARVFTHGLDSTVEERAAETITQLCYDLHALWNYGNYDSDYGSWYVGQTLGRYKEGQVLL